MSKSIEQQRAERTVILRMVALVLAAILVQTPALALALHGHPLAGVGVAWIGGFMSRGIWEAGK